MDHSRELTRNMNRYDQFLNMLFNNEKIEKSTSIASDVSFDEIYPSFLQKPTSTPTWKTIRRYEKPPSTDSDSMHFGSSSTLTSIPYSPLHPTDISSFWSDNRISLDKSLENMPLSFNQLPNIAPIQLSEIVGLPKRSDCLVPVERPEQTDPFQIEPHRMMEADMSRMMHGRDLGSFGHYQDLNNGIFGSQTSYASNLAYQQPRAAMVLHNEMSENGTHLTEKKGKAIPIFGRLNAFNSQGPVKSFSKLSLDEVTDCDDTEFDPSINARAIGLYPPPVNNWDRIVAEMQLCLQYLTQLGNRSKFGMERLIYTLEISHKYPKLRSHWHSLDKIIHTEYKSSFLFVRELQLSCQMEGITIATDNKVVFHQFDKAATAFEKTRDFSILNAFAHGVINKNEVDQLIASIGHVTSSVRATSNHAYAIQTLLEVHEKKQKSKPLAVPLVPDMIAPPVGNSQRIHKNRRIG